MWYFCFNGRTYKCLFETQFVSFIDTKDQSRFLTVGNDFTMRDLKKNPFFWSK